MSTVPFHWPSECSNVEARFGIFDRLMKCGIFNGTMAEKRERMKTCKNPELMCREFDLWMNGKDVVCSFCFWTLLYKNLPPGMRQSAETNENDNVRGLHVFCKREEIEEDRSLTRLGKQKTEPVRRYAFLLEDWEDEEGCDCRATFLYETDSTKKLADKEIKRRLPDNVRYAHMKEVAFVDIDYVTKHEDVQGQWIS